MLHSLRTKMCMYVVVEESNATCEVFGSLLPIKAHQAPSLQPALVLYVWSSHLQSCGVQ